MTTRFVSLHSDMFTNLGVNLHADQEALHNQSQHEWNNIGLAVKGLVTDSVDPEYGKSILNGQNTTSDGCCQNSANALQTVEKVSNSAQTLGLGIARRRSSEAAAVNEGRFKRLRLADRFGATRTRRENESKFK